MSATHKFSYTPNTSDYDDVAVTVESQAVVLDDLLAAFEAYLCATGFRPCLEGKRLELVDQERSDLS